MNSIISVPGLKEGEVSVFKILQNTTQYTLKLSNTAKGLWMVV